MRIPSEQKKEFVGPGVVTVPVNGNYSFTQITISGRSSGVISTFARPLLEDNSPDNFADDEFELLQDTDVDLSDNPPRRTFTIEHKRISALRFSDAGAGNLKYFIRQWNLVNG